MTNVILAFKNPKIDNPAACHAGLGITASNAADVLEEHGITARALPVVDGFDIRNRLRNGTWSGISHVVMNAPFFDTGFMGQLVREFPLIHFAVIFHSNVGFLGVDNWSTAVLGEQLKLQASVKNFTVAGNSEKLCKSVESAYGGMCTPLPNLYFLHGPIERLRRSWSGGPLRIGTFGATRILKNLPTAAWATCIIANRLGASIEFWVSEGRREGAGSENVMAGIRKVFQDHPLARIVESHWEPWLDFRRNTVRKMHLLLQPSFTESFNNVTADGIAEGVPSVVGPAINWVPRYWIANPDDAVEIADAGISLLRNRSAQRDGYRALVKHNDRALACWRSFLQ